MSYCGKYVYFIVNSYNQCYLKKTAIKHALTLIPKFLFKKKITVMSKKKKCSLFIELGQTCLRTGTYAIAHNLSSEE